MTYNIAVHDCGANKGHMMLWPETIAGRGADEIASCIYEYVKETNISSQKLVIYSDNCAGQNKNARIISLHVYLVGRNMFDEICHIFPITGHTMLPCDRDFGDIERKLRKLSAVYVPSDYVKCIQDSRKTNPFVVNEMTSADFISMDDMLKRLTMRKTATNGEKVDFRNISQLRILKENPMILHYRHTHNADESWNSVSLAKRGRQLKGVYDFELAKSTKTLDHCQKKR